MDYTKLPRQLLCRTRRSLEEFIKDNPANKYIIDNMSEIYFLQSADFKDRATDCLNAAHYICTLILADDYPEWSLPKYYEIAKCNKNSAVEQAVTLSIVRAFLNYYDSDWLDKHKKLIDGLDNFIGCHWIQQETPFDDGCSYHDVFEQISSFDVVLAFFSQNDFELREIDNNVIEEKAVVDFNWTGFTNYYDLAEMKSFVFTIGKTDDEKRLLIGMLRQQAKAFYTTDSPVYLSVCDRLRKIEKEADLNPQETVSNVEAPSYHEDVNSQQERIEELNAEIERLKEMLRLKQTAVSDAECETLKRQIEELEKDREHYKALAEAGANQLQRYEEILGPASHLDDWKEQLHIKERVILFQALTGCSLKGAENKQAAQASQQAKANLIARFSGSSPGKIRTVINALNKEIEEVETKKKAKFSDGTTDAAMNVYNYLHMAVEGQTIGSKPQQCQIAMQTIDQIYHLKIDRATPPPAGYDFLIEREPQE